MPPVDPLSREARRDPGFWASASEVQGAWANYQIQAIWRPEDHVLQILCLPDIRMSDEVLDATLAMRAFLFDAVYENEVATAEFRKATGVLGGLWEKVRERPAEFLDERYPERPAALRAPTAPFDQRNQPC